MTWQLVVLILGIWWGILFIAYTAGVHDQRNKDG